MIKAVFLILLIAESGAESCTSCPENGDDTIATAVINLMVERNEVRGFQCNVTTTNCGEPEYPQFFICINSSLPINGHDNDVLKDVLRENSGYQHDYEMVTAESNDSHCMKKFVNFKILTQQDFEHITNNSDGEKDKAYVVLIPSGNVVYCIIGAGDNECPNRPVVTGSAVRFVIENHSPIAPDPASSSASLHPTIQPTASSAVIETTTAISSSLSSKLPASSSTPSPVSTISPMPTEPSVTSSALQILSGTLGTYSGISTAAIIVLVVLLIFNSRCLERVRIHRSLRREQDSHELNGSLPVSHEPQHVLGNVHTCVNENGDFP